MYSCFFYSVCSRTIFRDIPIITIFDRISLIIMVTTSIPVGTNVVGEGPWLAPLPGDHLAGLPRIRTQRNLECAECLKRNHHCWNKSFLWFNLSIQTNHVAVLVCFRSSPATDDKHSFASFFLHENVQFLISVPLIKTEIALTEYRSAYMLRSH